MSEPDARTQRNPSRAAETRAEALEALSDAFAWRLADPRWEEISRILDAMTAALASGDVTALAAATARLELAGPLRIIPIGTATGPPPEVRELLNTLVHALDGVTVDGPPRDPGDTGAGHGDFPRG